MEGGHLKKKIQHFHSFSGRIKLSFRNSHWNFNFRTCKLSVDKMLWHISKSILNRGSLGEWNDLWRIMFALAVWCYNSSNPLDFTLVHLFCTSLAQGLVSHCNKRSASSTELSKSSTEESSNTRWHTSQKNPDDAWYFKYTYLTYK